MPQTPEFPYSVFLSHSSKDQAIVRPLAERLRADALKVWFDEWVFPVAASRQSAAFPSDKPETRTEEDGGALPRRRYAEKIEEGPFQLGTRNSEFGTPRPCRPANAFGSDWAQLLTLAQPLSLNPQPLGAPPNQERRCIPLRLDDAPIKGSLTQFLLPDTFIATTLLSTSGASQGSWIHCDRSFPFRCAIVIEGRFSVCSTNCGPKG